MMTPPPGDPSDPLSLGRNALAHAAWDAARAHFEATLAAEVTPEALEGLSWALWWRNDGPATLEAREQAYRLYRQRGDPCGAARMAVWLASDTLDFLGEPAVANGWIRRAHRLLDGLDPTPEHGWLAVHEGTLALDLEGQTETARRLGRECAELGRTLGVIDLEMLGLALEGLALVHDGEVAAGMRHLDEAVAAAVAGELGEIVSVGWSCCSLVKACEQVRDYDRAAQWANHTQAFAARVGFTPWFGICRAFYAGVLIWHGAWSQAEAELLVAIDELTASRPPWAAEGIVRLAELRRRQGRLEEAAALFDQVDPHPRAQLGHAQLALDRGDPLMAANLANRLLRNLPPEEKTERVPVLELAVRARVALGDRPGVAATFAELEAVASCLGTAPIRATTTFAAGLVAAAAGDYDAARTHFEDAVLQFSRGGAPFELAQARIELARSLLALDSPDLADQEVVAALQVLEPLGARTELERGAALRQQLAVSARIRATRSSSASGLSSREQEVLRLVGEGLSDKEIAALLVLSEHTVHRHVANILTKLDVPSRAAAVAQAAVRGLL